MTPPLASLGKKAKTGGKEVKPKKEKKKKERTRKLDSDEDEEEDDDFQAKKKADRYTADRFRQITSSLL